MSLEKSKTELNKGSDKKFKKKLKVVKFSFAKKKAHYSEPKFICYYFSGRYHYIPVNRKKHEPNFFYNSSL
jgi:hypothetical protein